MSIGEVNAPNTPPGIKRIPPRVDVSVPVSIKNWVINPRFAVGTIELSVDGVEKSGDVLINGSKRYRLYGSQTVKLRGVKQTFGGRGGLKLVARLGPAPLAESNAFSVAAYPVGIGMKFNRVLSPLTYGSPSSGLYEGWGAAYDLTFTSDSGTPADCGFTSVAENIMTKDATGIFVKTPTKRSGFIRTTTPQFDRHTFSVKYLTKLDTVRKMIDKAGVNRSTVVHHQFFRFACWRSGIAQDLRKAPKVPNSGFKITMTTLKSGKKYYIGIRKEGFANNNVAAGEVDDSSVKKAEIRQPSLWDMIRVLRRAARR